MSNLYNFQDFAEDCYVFNEIAGKDQQYSWNDLESQYKLIAEETNEILEGLDNRDIVEVLDGAVDVLVVTLGLLQKLQAAGVDVDHALAITAENNISKFVTYDSTAKATVEMYSRLGVDSKAEYNEKYRKYVIKDSNDKVRKPIGFISNNLECCIPTALKEGGLV